MLQTSTTVQADEDTFSSGDIAHPEDVHLWTLSKLNLTLSGIQVLIVPS